MHSCCHGNIHYTNHLILAELFSPLIVLHARSNLPYCKNMQNLENLDVFEILIAQNLLKCPKDPFVRSALVCNQAVWLQLPTFLTEDIHI